jgi:zinc transport system ATP-binding protein
MTKPVIEVNDLSVKFGEHLALDSLNLSIPQGAFVAIVGPNGAGKSTFLRVLLGLIQPTKGKIHIFNDSPNNIKPEMIGYVPQVKTMDRSFPALSIELVLTGINSRWPWKRDCDKTDRALKALERVGAEHLAQRPLAKLSGGELQRVCLARSIVREPQIVMLDEPATGIDVLGERDLYRLLEAYQKDAAATILMITHDWHAATHHADHVLLLNRKQISFGNPPEALNEDYLRLAFGHIGHEHELKFLTDHND